MKKVIFALCILVAISCRKMEAPITPTLSVQEEAIKFTTNLDTVTYNVADTLPLVITVVKINPIVRRMKMKMKPIVLL